jgi:hypothetical protein
MAIPTTGRSTDIIHATSILAYVLMGLHLVRWAVLNHPKVKGASISKSTSNPVANGVLSFFELFFWWIVELGLVLLATAIPIGVLNYAWQVQFDAINAEGATTYSEDDVFLFNLFAAAIALAVAATHMDWESHIKGKEIPTGTLESWWVFLGKYARGEYKGVGEVQPLFNQRLWSSLSVAIFIALVTDSSKNTWSTSALALAIVAAMGLGWLVWGFFLALAGWAAAAITKEKVTEEEMLYDVNASSAAGLCVLLFYSVIRMQDARSWITLISGGNTSRITVIVLPIGLYSLAILWAVVGRTVLNKIACCRSASYGAVRQSA